MQLSKQQEEEIKAVMNDYWSSYFEGKLDHWGNYLVDDYRNIGGTEEEIWNSKIEILDYTKRVIDQMQGATELRNKQTQIIPYDPYIMVHELLDIYIKIDNEWAFYQKFRLSSLIQKTADGWKVLHQHGSYPDSKTTEGEAFAFDTLKSENSKLQKAISERTVELEYKNRELEIEAATEKVRVQSMAMQHPEDLEKVNKELLHQLNQLKIPGLTGVSFYFVDENKIVTVWDLSSPGNLNNPNNYAFKFDSNKNPILGEFVEILQSTPQEYFILDFPKDRLLLAIEELKGIDINIAKKFTHAIESGDLVHQWNPAARITDGILSIDLMTPPDDDTKTILLKMAGAFNQAYTRFLDLQKAAAQSREAQIETALERVRSRSLAMHKSDELNEVVSVLFERLKDLHIPFTAVGIAISIEDSKDLNAFVCGENEDGLVITNYRLPYFDNKISNDFNKVLENQLDYFVGHYSKEEKDAFYTYLLEYTPEFRQLPENIKRIIFDSASYTVLMIAVNKATFNINDFEGKVLADDEVDIIKRFAKVFDQAYTRFLDLQKVEAQAREAEIEAALERVRSRTMAMQHSDELAEASFLLDSQVRALGIKTRGCAFNIYGENESTEWFSSELGTMPTYKTPRENFFLTYYEAGQRGDTLLIDEYEGVECVALYDYLCSLPVTGEGLRLFKASGGSFPAKQIVHVAFFKYGYLLFITLESVPEVHDVFKRFAKVFEQTYTRFLDLQNAEAQTREAQIEAALERVRSRSMGMQKSEELKEVIKVVYDQLIYLNINLDHAGFVVDYQPKQDWHFWIADKQEIPGKITHPYFDSVWANQFNEAKETGSNLFATNLDFEEKNKFYNELLSHVPGLPQISKDFYLNCPGLAASTVLMEDVGLYIENFTPTPYTDEENNILLRFGKVFQQSYTRFLDLQKAEAQAREAQIELGLERVRARAMAMQHSNELSDLVDTVFKELTKLDFALNWCIINIIDEPSLTNMVWAANPETNKPPESYLMKFEDYPFHHSMLKGYQERKPKHIYVIEGNEKTTYDNYLFNETEWRRVPKAAQDASKGMKRYVATFSFSNFGGLQTVGEEYLSEQNLDILSRFGKVFDLTYTRFNDLQKAEAQAREAQIQLALERVRARTMAMQHSDELPEAANLLFQQIQSLGMPAWSTGYCTWNDNEKNTVTLWMSSEGVLQPPFKAPTTEDELFIQMRKGQEDGKTFHVVEMGGDKLVKHYGYMRTLPVVGEILDSIIAAGHPLPTFQIMHHAYFSKGFLLFITYEPVPDAHIIFQRFGKVFDQTYTRFLDLQKAEAQAREAQIEAGLERVRASAMAMHSTTGFLEVTKVLREQVALLGEKELESIIIHIYNEQDDLIEVWYSYRNPHDKEGKVADGRNTVSWSGMARTAIDKKKYYSNDSDYTIVADLPMLTEWYQYLQKTIPVVVDLDGEGNIIVPDVLYYNYSKFTGGALLLITNSEASENSKNLLSRSAKVFNLAYTRFLDLQKAEFQTRQAKIETALEKVRARALAMQLPEELIEVAEVLRYEMGVLGVEELETCSIYIHDEKINRTECWYALKDIGSEEKKLVSDHFPLNLQETWVGREMEKFYGANVKQVSIVMQGAHRKEWINYCEEKSIPFRGYYGEEIPDRTYHLYKFSHGAIGAASAGDISAESWDLLQRAASVFSLAYSRFKDLTQARIDLQKLKEEKQRAETALSELQTTQKQLIQSEKMASLGELTAGIAHEIQNPLNFVNNFSEVSTELVDEMNEELATGNKQYAIGNVQEANANMQNAIEIANDLKQNLEKINHHGKRACDIVKGMLQHSRSSNGVKEPTDINALCDEYLRLAYHGLRAKDKSFNATMKTDFDETIGNINIIPQDIGRVMLNLITNAFYAASLPPPEKIGTGDGGFLDPAHRHEPTVWIKTSKIPPSGGGGALISVRDNGPGIPQKILDKIFQPFFTTKPTGQGTGLGLSLAYDIVKAHGGEIKVETKEGEGTEFVILFPV